MNFTSAFVDIIHTNDKMKIANSLFISVLFIVFDFVFLVASAS